MAQVKKTSSQKAKTTLVQVEKDGVVIEISPRQVEQHKRLGWTKVTK